MTKEQREARKALEAAGWPTPEKVSWGVNPTAAKEALRERWEETILALVDDVLSPVGRWHLEDITKLGDCAYENPERALYLLGFHEHKPVSVEQAVELEEWVAREGS